MIRSKKNTNTANIKRPLWISLAVALLLAAATMSLTSCHNQPKPEETEQDSTISNEQKLADLEAQKAVAEKEYAEALQAAEKAQAEADQKAKIAKKKGTKEAKAEADEAQKKADKLKADADAKGARVDELDEEIIQLKMIMAGVDEETYTPKTENAAKKEKKSAVNTENKTKNSSESQKVTEASLQKDFETILAKWKNGKNSKQKANQFCTGTLGIRIKNNDPYTTLEQNFKSLDKENKSEMINHMRNFKFSSDEE